MILKSGIPAASFFIIKYHSCRIPLSSSEGTRQYTVFIFRIQTERKDDMNKYRDYDNYLKEYPSVRDASADLGIHHTTIGHVASGRDAHCHGLVFRYFKADKIAKTKVHKSKREVHQYALTGEYVASYQTLRDACKAVGLSDPHGIRDSCKSEKTASGGYQWRYYKTDSVGGLNNLKHHYS